MLIFLLSLCLSATPLIAENEYDKSFIRQTVHKHLPKVRKCFEKALPSSSKRQKLVMAWEILESGKVGSVSVEQKSTKEVDDCVSKLVESWTFPKPNGRTVKVKYPFVFSNIK